MKLICIAIVWGAIAFFFYVAAMLVQQVMENRKPRTKKRQPKP